MHTSFFTTLFLFVDLTTATSLSSFFTSFFTQKLEYNSCTTNTDCTDSMFCNDGYCTVKLANYLCEWENQCETNACSSNADCDNLDCVDNFCVFTAKTLCETSESVVQFPLQTSSTQTTVPTESSEPIVQVQVPFRTSSTMNVVPTPDTIVQVQVCPLQETVTERFVQVVTEYMTKIVTFELVPTKHCTETSKLNLDSTDKPCKHSTSMMSSSVKPVSSTSSSRPTSSTTLSTSSVRPASSTMLSTSSVRPASSTILSTSSVRPASSTTSSTSSVRPASSTMSSTSSIRPASSTSKVVRPTGIPSIIPITSGFSATVTYFTDPVFQCVGQIPSGNALAINPKLLGFTDEDWTTLWQNIGPDESDQIPWCGRQLTLTVGDKSFTGTIIDTCDPTGNPVVEPISGQIVGGKCDYPDAIDLYGSRGLAFLQEISGDDFYQGELSWSLE